jgi:hypothetical protein
MDAYKRWWPDKLMVLVLASSLAAPIAADANSWAADNVSMQSDTRWNADSGSMKSESLTSGAARIDASSHKLGAPGSYTADLERVYKRTYTKTGSPADLTLVITLQTDATADTASTGGQAQASGQGTAASGYGQMGGVNLGSSASQNVAGLGDPALVSDPKNRTSTGQALNATTTATATLKATTAAGGGSSATAAGTSFSKVTFSDP